jgi:tetratricopeptide (TPR) repeat protein
LPGALDHFQREFAIVSALASSDPTNATYKRAAATSRSYIGGVLESLGRDDDAIEQRVAQLNSERQLHESDRTNVNWQRNLALTETRLADLLRRRGESARAAALLADGEALMRDLVARPAARPTWRRDLAVIRIAVSRVHLASGRAAAALDAANEAVRLLEAPPAQDPVWTRFLAEANLVSGDALLAAGRQGEAHAAYSHARAVIEGDASTATDPSVLDIYARATLCAGKDAAPLLGRLERIGYRHRDLVALVDRRAAGGA